MCDDGRGAAPDDGIVVVVVGPCPPPGIVYVLYRLKDMRNDDLTLKVFFKTGLWVMMILADMMTFNTSPS